MFLDEEPGNLWRKIEHIQRHRGGQFEEMGGDGNTSLGYELGSLWFTQSTNGETLGFLVGHSWIHILAESII